jgi:hypothetical protein
MKKLDDEKISEFDNEIKDQKRIKQVSNIINQ